MASRQSAKCQLCASVETKMTILHKSQKTYWKCTKCALLFLDSVHHLSQAEEKARYDCHHNDINDKGYIRFVSQILGPLDHLINTEMSGLDYGCGPTNVLAKIMNKQGYNVASYDPYYFPELEQKKYDFITCTEVVEHFYQVGVEWSKMIDLLSDDGILAIMTEFYSEITDLNTWYYLRDSTHTAFYHESTFGYLCRRFGLEIISIVSGRVVIFRKMVARI
jgi:2-polyprenyl-3-methyl-5-hydroxy-6-metoxy-1,4-benzoquinol methylase